MIIVVIITDCSCYSDANIRPHHSVLRTAACPLPDHTMVYQLAGMPHYVSLSWWRDFPQLIHGSLGPGLKLGFRVRVELGLGRTFGLWNLRTIKPEPNPIVHKNYKQYYDLTSNLI